MLPPNALSQIALIGMGGFLGSISRFYLSGVVHRIAPHLSFPLGTLAVNVLGCFLIGLLYGLTDTRQLFGDEARLFLVIGVFGGFTTFSTFGYETLALLRDAEFTLAVLSVLMHLVAGLGAVWVGDSLGRVG
ncbi:MAG: fluoride efflux transporter CrcB [Nitrospirales bacterium]|nr:fluoride efflux transporter CrcB [Nitrospirales bacterium]